MSLRARLVLGTIVLAAAGLAVADVATYTSLRSFLLDRVDRSLDQAHVAAERPFGGDGGHGPGGPGPGGGTPGGLYVGVRNAQGALIVNRIPRRFDDAQASPPQLPTTVALPAESSGPGSPDRAVYLTVPAQDGGDRYRVRASRAPGSTNTVFVALSLRDVDGTLHRLLLVELFATLGVLAAIAGLGLWVVRLGLRPLEAIGRTAAAIAAGDLSQRVARAEQQTEVGRLGLALNAMLGQIEAAFNARAASEQRLRRFVADASHELRTPLAAVRAYAELFGRGADRRPDDLARAMTGIGRESERMSLLVDDLLLLARLDEGRPLERVPVALEEVVREAVETAHAVDPERRIELEASGAPVLGDRDRLRQIVDNLLGNVRSHTPPATPVHVRVGREDGYAVIEVSDSGPGMTQEQVERVFERFYRADPSRSRASGGVGLGLSIVAAVTEAHGGTVAAESEPGRGATFRISLPAG